MTQLDTLIGFALTHLDSASVHDRISLLKTAAEHLTDPDLREHCEVTAAALKHAEACQLKIAEFFHAPAGSNGNGAKN